MKKIAVLIGAAVLCLGLGGCGNQTKMTAEEVVSTVLTTYQQGDYEGLKPYIQDDNRLHWIFAAVSAETPTDMENVYRQVYELTKGLTFTAKAVEGKEKWGEVSVEIKTENIMAGVPDAMAQAIKEEVENGGGQFKDLPAWLINGIRSGEPVDEVISVKVTTQNKKMYLDTSTNNELFEILTGGFYTYMDMSMTTCTEEGDSYLIASDGDRIIGMVETVRQSAEGAELTDADLQAYADTFRGVDGLRVKLEKDGSDSFVMRMGIDFRTASSAQLAKLGIISDQITAGGGYLSLRTSVKGFEDSGMTCVTDDFGTGEKLNQEK